MVNNGLVLPAVILGVIWCISGQRLCPRLQKPWNGQFIGSCNRNVGAQCMFQCRDPYILVGSSVRVCRGDGTWSGATTACELDGCTHCDRRSNCANLYNPDYGYTEGQCTPGIAGQVCTFRCYSGYSLEGVSRITCLEGGHWSSTPPMCRRTSAALCEDIVVPNGRTGCSEEGGLTVCRIVCDEGYMIVGSSVITCSSSGDWNAQIPSCRRTGTGVDVTNVCPTLVAPEGGRLLDSCVSARTGETCQLVCLSGYRPTDTRVLICQPNGRWSDTLPRCVADSRGCPVITVSQGSSTGNCGPAQVGHICTITCNPGYTLSGGSGTLVCQANGEWSGTIPTCTARTCPPLARPVSGDSSGTCSPGQVGQTCNFYCNAGYQLVGQSVLTCGNDGRWSGNPPYCTAGPCPNLNAPANGARSGTCEQATVGQSCSFSCQAGYVLNGQATVFCQAGGTWSSPAPTCRRVTCPNLNAPANGVTSESCAQKTVGQSCTFACISGYTLRGSATLFCQEGGEWSSQTPTCIPSAPTSCPNLVAPSNGFTGGTCAPGRVGETCIFGCNEGFALNGRQRLICLSNGQWSSAPPECEETDNGNGEDGNCPELTPPPNGDFLGCDNRPGGQCTVVCDKGYTRSGSRVRTCLGSGMWSGYAPTCTRTVGYTTYTKYKVVPLWKVVFG